MASFCRRSLNLRALAKSLNVGLTIDAEEVNRLDLSLDLFESLAAEPSLKGWNGLGLAVQAYGKRAKPVLEWLARLAEANAARSAGAAGEGRLLGYGNQAGPGSGA